MKIITHGHHETFVEYRHDFGYVDRPSAGFSYDVDEQGNLLSSVTECARDGYRQCLTGTIDGKKVVDNGIVRYEHSYYQPAIGRCDCGQEMTLGRFTNTCECGRDYNSAGQMLAPRSQWGEETGETYADIQDL
jgi:hypothetical protein